MRPGVAGGYLMLADLVAGDRDAVAAARDNEVLAGWLTGSSDAEVMAAHYDCLGRNAFPHAGVYLDPDGLITGDGELSGALRRLAALEARGAIDAVRSEMAALLAWLPPFAVAARASDARPWPQIIDLAIELIAERAAELEVVAERPELGRFEVDSAAGLGEVATSLCLPHRAGFLLTVAALRHLARRLALPAGFGARRQLLRRFLESAATFERGGEALAGLEDLVAGTTSRLLALSEHPGLSGPCRPWIEQSSATRATLARMRAELLDAGSARVADG